MTYGISFILGIIIAATALVLQVIGGIVSEVFVHTAWQPSYVAETFSAALPTLLITACIEECVRVSMIAKKFLSVTLTPAATWWHSASLGAGFWTTELTLRLLGTAPTSPLAALLPLLIHITASGIAIIILAQWRTVPVAARIAVALTGAILIHSAGNALIFALPR